MDVIAAIATGANPTAIGIVRVSGEGCFALCEQVFRAANGRPFAGQTARKMIFGEMLDREKRIIDQGLAVRFPGPGSYTGEDCAEFHCHGSPVVLRELLSALFAAGARQAQAGEFTKRAFLNGRMDLTQAEAVVDLIDAETAAGARNAAAQLEGGLRRTLEPIQDALLEITSRFYAVVDYPDEDIEPFELPAYAERLDAGAAELRRLLASFERGRVLREGLPAAIIGRPNAGKSSLLNALLGYERAIVTAQPGTTRDTIEEKALLGGVLLRLTDTAGLRAASDEAEREGVRRAFAAAEGAELVLAVFDGSEPLSEADAETLAAARGAKRAVCVLNKADLPQALDAGEFSGFGAVVRLSARTGEGLGELAEVIAALFPAPEAPAGEILTNARQAEAVQRALAALDAACETLAAGFTPDAVLTEAEEALDALAELTGRSVRDDVTERIFSRFCVGK